VTDPERYGVVEFDAAGRAISIEEKPKAAEVALRRHRPVLLRQPRSVDIANLKPSRAANWRSPTSTGSISNGQLNVEIMGRGMAWLDTGTHDSLLEAGQFIRSHRKAPGPQGRLPGRDRLAHEMDRRRAA
jgi:glucose-1-phosphate thymidylyltransferase